MRIIFDQKLLIFQDNSSVMHPEVLSERYKASFCQGFTVHFSSEVKPPNVTEASQNARDLHFERFLWIRWLNFGGKIGSKFLAEAGSQCEKLPWQLQCSVTQLVFFKFLAYRKHWNVLTLATDEMKVSAVTYTIYHSIINSIHKCNCN